MRKRIVSFFLCMCMIFMWIPNIPFAEAKEPDQEIMLGTSGIEGYDGLYDYIYYGYWTAQNEYTTSGPIKYRVLDDQTNTMEEGLLLLSDALLTVEQNGEDFGPQNYNDWQGSYAQAWCKDFAGIEGNTVIDALSAVELEAILETTKSDSYFVTTDINMPIRASSNILNQDKVFFLSAEEAENPEYGFVNTEDRIAYIALQGEPEDGSGNYWWLRSPVASRAPVYNSIDTAIVTSYGKINGYKPTGRRMIRPAFNLDQDAALFSSAAAGGKGSTDGDIVKIGAYDGNEWKLTLLDSNRQFHVEKASITEQSGDTIKLQYTGATVYDPDTAPNEYISIMINSASDGMPLYYGRVAQPAAENGTMNMVIPSDIAPGNYVLNVFSEQYNGDYKTDYASAFQALDLTVEGGLPAPVLTPGNVNRTSDSSAEVAFTSDQEGTYYYAVVESGAAEPDVDTSGTGTSCGTTEQTISLDSLAAGAKDIYIVVKSTAGVVSEKLKITIPAYTALSGEIEVTPTVLDFGSRAEEYIIAPDAQTVVLTNKGSQAITLMQPTAQNYTLGALSDLELAAGESATLSVQPKAGLKEGKYEEVLTIYGEYENGSVTSIEIRLKFTVSSGESDQTSGSGNTVTKYPIIVESTGDGTAVSNKKEAASGENIVITANGVVNKITVSDKAGKEISVTDNGNGSYTFKMPASEVTVSVAFVTDISGVSEWLNTKNHMAYLNGYENEEFRPDNDMTRAEAAQMFYNLLLDRNVPITVSFSDVQEDAWYAEAVNTLASLGMVLGVSENQFEPDRSITRAEFVTIAMRFANRDIQGENIFADISADDWFYDDIVGAVQYGWITGYSDDLFCPDKTITRAEVTTVVNRMLGRCADEAFVNDHQAELNRFRDVYSSYWAYYNIVEATNEHDYTRDGKKEVWII